MADQAASHTTTSIGRFRWFLCSAMARMRPIWGLHSNKSVAGAVLVLMLVPLGCSGFRGPEVKVAGVVVSDATDEGLELEIYLDLTNSNDRGMELRLFEYSVWADGVRAYEGVWSAEQTIPAASMRSAMIPAVLLDQQLGWSAQNRPRQVKMRIMGTILYIAPGQFAETLLEWGIYQPRQSFGAEDSVELIPEHKTPENPKPSSTGS